LGLIALAYHAEPSTERLKNHARLKMNPNFFGFPAQLPRSPTITSLRSIMLEALWSVEFKSSFGMLGGFRVENGSIHSEINVKRYASVPGMSSVVGFDNFNLVVTGKPDAKDMVLSGYVVEDPSRKITVHAVRRAELP
jgi:hypothetical protein